MPITGIPDRERHRFCIKCHQWCEPEEGRDVAGLDGPPPRTATRKVPELLITPRFMCHRCSRQMRWFIWSIVALLAIAAIVVVTLKELGIIK